MRRDDEVRGIYRISFSLIGDEWDTTLTTVLESIGRAIAEADERIKTIGERYGCDAADMASEDEIPVIEDLLGAAFVVCQTYITGITSRLRRIRQYAKERDNVDLFTTGESKSDMMRYGFHPTTENPYSPVEVLNAFANYYKHQDEWGHYDWEKLKAVQLQTARIITSAGARESTTGNLRTGAEFLGNREYSNVMAFAAILLPWRKDLISAYRSEVGARIGSARKPD